MRSPSEAAIDAEHRTIELVEAFLNLPKNRHGATIRQIVEGTGMSEGRIREVLLKSTCAILQKPRNRQVWYLDYSTIEEGWRPQPRQKSTRGRKPKPKPLIVCPRCGIAVNCATVRP